MGANQASVKKFDEHCGNRKLTYPVDHADHQLQEELQREKKFYVSLYRSDFHLLSINSQERETLAQLKYEFII